MKLYRIFGRFSKVRLFQKSYVKYIGLGFLFFKQVVILGCLANSWLGSEKLNPFKNTRWLPHVGASPILTTCLHNLPSLDNKMVNYVNMGSPYLDLKNMRAGWYMMPIPQAVGWQRQHERLFFFFFAVVVFFAGGAGIDFPSIFLFLIPRSISSPDHTISTKFHMVFPINLS